VFRVEFLEAVPLLPLSNKLATVDGGKILSDTAARGHFPSALLGAPMEILLGAAESFGAKSSVKVIAMAGFFRLRRARL
jgi:hypothetical protein